MSKGRQRRTPGLYRRGKAGVWYIQKRVRVGNGRTIQLQETTGTSSLVEAERFLARRIEQTRAEYVYGERPTITLAQAAARYLDENQHLRSIERSAYALARIVPELGHLPLEGIHDGTVQPYVRMRLQSVSAGTVNKELAVLKRVLSLAARSWRTEAGMTYLSVVPLLTPAQGDSRTPYPLTTKEEVTLLAELPEHLVAMTRFALHTGVRGGELCALRWGWELEVPELGVSVFVLPKEFAKNGEARVIVLNETARSIVAEQRGLNPEYVFSYNGQPLTRVSNHAWRKARTRAGLSRLRFHDMRHTFGHRLRAVGVSNEDRHALLGHTTGDITTHYSAAELGVLLNHVEKLVGASTATVLRSGWATVQQIFNESLNEMAVAH